MTHRPLLATIGLAATLSASAADTLPDPAIPGLRYYYPPEKVEARTTRADIAIYGGTSGGAAAAIQAARMGNSVVLLEFGKHIGGLTSGGLSHTDGGGSDVCGGIAREVYNQIGQANFRPSHAERVYRALLEEAGVEIHTLAHLATVEKEGSKLVALTMEDGLRVEASQFIDATYEGDLFGRAGVSFHAGREANDVYGETYNGIRALGKGGHNFPARVDPYREAGDPESGLLPRVVDDPGVPGAGDAAIQAFCFRMRLTKDDPLPFPKPAVYDLDQYEILARLFETGADPRPAFSIDTNNHHLFGGAYFIDFVGGNYDWPTADWATRERLFQDHANYQIGVMHFLTNSPRVPEKWRAEFARWGLPKDEYPETGGWTHQLYIREGRRLLGDYVMTQHNCQGTEVPEDSIGLATYNMDSHHCQMGVVDGAVRNEGNVEIRVAPYPIAYRALLPKREEAANLLVPVALSSSHIAFGSIRMEPVFMILGQSAATAASLAIDSGTAIHDLDYSALRERLLADGQILAYDGPKRNVRSSEAATDPQSLPGIVVDDSNANFTGSWTPADVISPRVGPTYRHNNTGTGKATFAAELDAGQEYEIRLAYSAHPNRATKVAVTLSDGAGAETEFVNQQETPDINGHFVSLGRVKLRKDATYTVEISAGGIDGEPVTDGYVIADAVWFFPIDR